MALVHRADLNPTTLELLAGWLPRRRWYRGPTAPQLTLVGAFRFDDPAGEVGIETMLVSTGDEIVFQVPLSYRGTPLPDRDDWLIGTAEHSGLGTRWIYDGCGDPVYVAALAGAVLASTGQAEGSTVIDDLVGPCAKPMTISSTIGVTGVMPVIDALAAVLDSDEVTTIITASAVLSVMRGLELNVPPPSAAIPALTGSWNGRPNPVVLATAIQR